MYPTRRKINNPLNYTKHAVHPQTQTYARIWVRSPLVMYALQTPTRYVRVIT